MVAAISAGPAQTEIFWSWTALIFGASNFIIFSPSWPSQAPAAQRNPAGAAMTLTAEPPEDILARIAALKEPKKYE
jgi:hypothetical protein